MKTRLKRGLEKLKDKLDAGYQGDRKSWCLALAPLTGLNLPFQSAPPLLFGVVAMTTKVKISVAALVILGVTALLWQVLNGPPLGNVDSLLHTSDKIQEEESIREDSGLSPVDETASSITKPNEIAREIVQPKGTNLVVKIKDGTTGRWVKAFDFSLSRQIRQEPAWVNLCHATVQDEGGSFSCPIEEAGRFVLMIRSSSYLPYTLRDIDLKEDEGRVIFPIALDPGASVSGRVIEDATEKPVSGVLVSADLFPGFNLDHVLAGFTEHDVHTRTDEQGRFTLKGLERKGNTVAALHPDYAEGFVEAAPGGEVEIRLRQGYRIFGRAYGDEGQPAEGVAIRLSGGSIPVDRTVFTSRDGSFRTGPMLSGWVRVEAVPPPGEKEATFGFTRETKFQEITNKDCEVDFGPCAEHVTWRGTFYDYDGKAVPKLLINVKRPNRTQSYPLFEPMRSVHTDDQGRFEIRKLLAQEYHVDLWYPGHSVKVDLGEIVFDRPGIVKRDIHAAGAVIKGNVKDERSGERIVEPMPFVMAISSSNMLPRAFTSRVDEEGQFCLRGLPPGAYQLSASASGYIPCGHPKVTVEKDQVIDDFVIKLKKSTRLVLEFVGFERDTLREFDLYLSCNEESERRFLKRKIREGEAGFDLLEGSYAARIVFKGFNELKRSFEIVPGETEEEVIYREELVRDDGLLTMKLELSHAAGAPIAGAGFHLYPLVVPGSDPYTDSCIGTTDSEGRVTMTGFMPGKWKVSARLAEGGKVDFEDLVVPEDGPDPFLLHLILHGGTVSGTFVDKLTGRVFSDTEPKWWVYLYEAETGEVVSQLQGGHVGPRFKMAGIQRGEYKLRVTVLGYETFESEPFFLAEGQALDMGAITMAPLGILDLEVVDLEGKHVRAFRVLYNEKPLKYYQTKHLSLGKCRCYNLPLGSVEITVCARGYEDKKFTLNLDPNKPQQKKVTLFKEP